MIYQNIAQTIGKTPVVKLKTGADEAEIYAKLEFFNPGFKYDRKNASRRHS